MSHHPWLEVARAAAQSREAFERHFQELPGSIRHLLKHLDPRSHSQRPVEKELAAMELVEREALRALLKFHQAFPLNHKFERQRHESKYRGKAGNLNHLVPREELKGFDKRNPLF